MLPNAAGAGTYAWPSLLLESVLLLTFFEPYLSHLLSRWRLHSFPIPCPDLFIFSIQDAPLLRLNLLLSLSSFG